MVSLFVLSPFPTLWMRDGRVPDGFGKAKTITAAFKLIVVFLCFLAMRHGVLPSFGRWGFICDECLQKTLAKQDVSFGIAKPYLLRSNRYGFAVSNDTFCNVISYVCATICSTDGYEKDGSDGAVVKLLDKKRWDGRLRCGDARFIVVAQSRGSFPLLA